MVYESLFYVNYVHGFMFSMSTNENFKYAKKIFIGFDAARPKKPGCMPKILRPKYMECILEYMECTLLKNNQESIQTSK